MRKSERRRKQISTHVASDGRFFSVGTLLAANAALLSVWLSLKKGDNESSAYLLAK